MYMDGIVYLKEPKVPIASFCTGENRESSLVVASNPFRQSTKDSVELSQAAQCKENPKEMNKIVNLVLFPQGEAYIDFCARWGKIQNLLKAKDYYRAYKEMDKIYNQAERVGRESLLPSDFLAARAEIPPTYFRMVMDNLPPQIQDASNKAKGDPQETIIIMKNVLECLITFFGIVKAESKYNPTATNAGALGLGQIKPNTAAQYTEILYWGNKPVNLFDPKTNLIFAFTYFMEMIKNEHPDLTKELTSEKLKQATLHYKRGENCEKPEDAITAKYWREVSSTAKSIMNFSPNIQDDMNAKFASEALADR